MILFLFLVSLWTARAVDPLLLYTFPQSECTGGTFTERMGTGVDMQRDATATTCIHNDEVGDGVRVDSCATSPNVLATPTGIGNHLFNWTHMNLSVEIWFSVLTTLDPNSTVSNVILELSPHTEHDLISEETAGSYDVSTDRNSIHLSIEQRRIRQEADYETPELNLDFANINAAVLFNKGGFCENLNTGILIWQSSEGYQAEFQGMGSNSSTVYKLMFTGVDLFNLFYIKGSSDTIEYTSVLPLVALNGASPIRLMLHPEDRIRAGCSANYIPDISMSFYKIAIYGDTLSSAQVVDAFNSPLV